MRSGCCDLSSTLHLALFTVSLIFLFILLIFIFTFHVGRFANEYSGTLADNTPLTYGRDGRQLGAWMTSQSWCT